MLLLLSFFLQLDLELADPPGLKLPGHLQESSDLLPVNVSSPTDESLVLLEVFPIAVKKCIHMLVIELEAELCWQKIVSDECHQQDKVIYYVLNRAIFHYLQLFLKLSMQILSQYVDEDKLELRRPQFSVS